MAIAVPATVRLLLTEITTDVVVDGVIESYSDGTVGPEVMARLASVWASPHTDPPAIVVLIYNLLTCADIVDGRINADDEESQWAKAKRDRAMSLIAGLVSGEIAIDPAAETTEDSTAPLILVSDRTEAYAADVRYVTTDETQWLTTSSETRDSE